VDWPAKELSIWPDKLPAATAQLLLLVLLLLSLFCSCAGPQHQAC
jgi:hypothetical protein